MWRGPCAFVPLRDCEAACERSGSGVIILLGGVWFCMLQRYFGDGSRMVVAFWCSAVFFSRFSVYARSRWEFGDDFLRVFVGGRRVPSRCLSFWLCSLFFLYVVFRDYLLVFSSSLSMKWAPSCAGSLKKSIGTVSICRYSKRTLDIPLQELAPQLLCLFQNLPRYEHSHPVQIISYQKDSPLAA